MIARKGAIMLIVDAIDPSYFLIVHMTVVAVLQNKAICNGSAQYGILDSDVQSGGAVGLALKSL